MKKEAVGAPKAPARRLMPTEISRLRVFANSPAAHFEAGFREIAQTRMKGLPILNPRVSVRAENFRRWGNDWIGTVTTPWAIIVVYACGCRESWVDVRAHTARSNCRPGISRFWAAGTTCWATFCRCRS